MVGLLAVLFLVQTPTVSVDVDRGELEVGDRLTVTVRVDNASAEAIGLEEQPRFPGFTVSGISQGSMVSFRQNREVRTTTWTFSLRAVAPGRHTIGPVRVRAGLDVIASAPVSVNVVAVDGGRRVALPARLRAIVNRAPGPDGSEDVLVSVVPSRDTLVLGEQLDLVVVAWFPRDVRARLRTRPTLAPPELRGAWTYAQTSALGVVSSREVAGRLYDLFVHSQIVFPLTPGPFKVGPASVSYNLPLRTSILSREIPQEVLSQPIEVMVRPQPPGPAGASPSAAGSGLRLDAMLDTGGFATGGAGQIAVTVTGRGNVSLWPEPDLQWPVGIRVYPGQTDVDIGQDSGYVVGSKTFYYLVVPDSIGAYTVPGARLDYFDPDRGRWLAARTEPMHLVSRVGRTPGTGPPVGPRLVAATGPTLARRLAGWLPLSLWLVVLAVPPLLMLWRPLLARRARGVTRRVRPLP